MAGLWDWVTSPFSDSGSGGSTPGYGSLTPDQQQLVTQQGWYPRPDMVMPSGQALQQPQGYSGLNPAQAATVGSQQLGSPGLGYYSNTDAQQPQSLWDKVKSAMTGDAGRSAIGDLQNALKGPQPLGNTMPQVPLQRPAGLLNPYHNLYTPVQLDPKQALLRYQRGY